MFGFLSSFSVFRVQIGTLYPNVGTLNAKPAFSKGIVIQILMIRSQKTH